MFRTACYVYTYLHSIMYNVYIFVDLIQNNFDKTIGIGKREINQ